MTGRVPEQGEIRFESAVGDLVDAGPNPASNRKVQRAGEEAGGGGDDIVYEIIRSLVLAVVRSTLSQGSP